MTQIGNKTPGGGGMETVAVDGVTITGDGVGTPLTAVAQSSDPSEGGTKLYNIARSAWEIRRAGFGHVTSVADNGSGKLRVNRVRHSLISGDEIDVVSSSGASYNGTAHVVTKVNDDVFDLEAVAYAGVGAFYFWCLDNVYIASDQSGQKVAGSTVRSIFCIGVPDIPGTPTIVIASDLVRCEYGGTSVVGFQRTRLDPSIGAGYHDFVLEELNGEICSYSGGGRVPDTGKLYRIDYVIA